AAGLANLEVILEEQLVPTVFEKEALFRELLVHPKIKEVRGMGLMLCMQLDSFQQVEQVSQLCSEEGVIIDWFLHCETAMRIAPPLIITTAEIRKVCKVIIAALDQL